MLRFEESCSFQVGPNSKVGAKLEAALSANAAAVINVATEAGSNESMEGFAHQQKGCVCLFFSVN